MNDPLCKLCKQRHPIGSCPMFAVNTPGAVNKLHDLAANKPQNGAANTNPESGNPAPILDAANTKCQPPTVETPGYMARSRYRDADKRREYMRRYMSGRRAIKNGR